ncbi:hypothetical protein PR202_gb11401 [Eleusine coracana subsp. coracana]|uniref:Uncharacterized protein n=1 Tax=Eleusine coracana subsp. coracana TaxID=191504 RepID=A0AAV5EK51_ELECO|nr:hypothetical protein PR202_gb11401 [Eleusine coracana subsp. coracana]
MEMVVDEGITVVLEVVHAARASASNVAALAIGLVIATMPVETIARPADSRPGSAAMTGDTVFLDHIALRQWWS